MGMQKNDLETKVSSLADQMTIISKRLNEASDDMPPADLKLEGLTHRMVEIENELKRFPSTLSDMALRFESNIIKNKQLNTNLNDQFTVKIEILADNLKTECLKL